MIPKRSLLAGPPALALVAVTALGPAPAHAAAAFEATVQHLIVDETDGGSGQVTAVELAGHTVEVDEPALEPLKSGTRVDIEVAGASSAAQAVEILTDDPSAIASVRVVAGPPPTAGTQGAVVHDLSVLRRPERVSVTLPSTSYLARSAMTVGVQALDAAGNASTEATAGIAGVDTTAPGWATIRQPAAWSAVTGAYFTLTWDTPTETGSGVDRCELLLDGEVVQTVAAGVNSATLPTPEPFVTYNTVAVRPVDVAGNVASAYQIGIYSQIFAPEAPVLTSPARGQILTSHEVHLAWDQPNPADVAEYRLTVDRAVVGPAPAYTDREWTLTLPDGSHTIKLTAMNPMGVQSTPAVSVTVRTVTQPAPWTVGTRYAIGDTVTYLGTTYRCRQAHTAQAGWQPASTPALWEPIT